MQLRSIGFAVFGIAVLVMVGSAGLRTANAVPWGAVSSTSTISESEVRSELLALPAPLDHDCTTCGNCISPNQHRIEGEGPDRRRLEPDHACDDIWGAGTCSERDHEESTHCQPVAPEAEFVALDNPERNRLWNLLVTEDAADSGLASDLAAFGNAISYNAARQAVQVRAGCDGSMITMSIPLTRDQAGSLSRTELGR